MIFVYKSIIYLKSKIIISIINRRFFFKSIHLILCSVEFRILYKSLKKILYNFFFLGLCSQKLLFFSRKVKKRLTLNKSPFVNKKSKDQYELRLLGTRVVYHFYIDSYFYFFFFKIQEILLTKNVYIKDFISALSLSYKL